MASAPPEKESSNHLNEADIVWGLCRQHANLNVRRAPRCGESFSESRPLTWIDMSITHSSSPLLSSPLISSSSSLLSSPLLFLFLSSPLLSSHPTLRPNSKHLVGRLHRREKDVAEANKRILTTGSKRSCKSVPSGLLHETKEVKDKDRQAMRGKGRKGSKGRRRRRRERGGEERLSRELGISWSGSSSAPSTPCD
ncbi:unnamed protein product [Pleuronectes platessa]|uniref:Uncharacterized protein n=1 Tax=Pleuronectes platessa TaxID=8262 RepID=A0A9N7YB09_PLEPL|nr:unnamed protein product [Pleuronectes platessa]